MPRNRAEKDMNDDQVLDCAHYQHRESGVPA
jgi:hypothetical protein